MLGTKYDIFVIIKIEHQSWSHLVDEINTYQGCFDVLVVILAICNDVICNKKKQINDILKKNPARKCGHLWTFRVNPLDSYVCFQFSLVSKNTKKFMIWSFHQIWCHDNPTFFVENTLIQFLN